MKVNESFAKLLNDKSRVEIIYGGAGSGKSHFVAEKILIKSLSEKGHKWLIVRKVARTIRYSVWALITSLISQEDLNRGVKINKTDFSITFANGNEIIFLGLDDVEKLKSIFGITGIWIEEASEITEDDFKQCNLRLRGVTRVQKQIILTFNPISHLHWLKKIFFDNKRDNCIIHKSTYKDNVFIDDEYKRELENLKNEDLTFYNIYALGEWGVLGNLVFTNYIIEDWNYPVIKDKEGNDHQLSGEDYFDDIYYGVDFGFNDPSAMVKVGFKDGELYVFDEFYQRELTNTDLIEEAKQFFQSKMIVADSAEPDRITEFRRAGFNCSGAAKGKDSVKHGIDFLRRYKIHIHKTKCINTANEIQMYSYKKDKDGNVVDEPVGFNDHAISAIRYAIEPLRLQNQIRISDVGAAALGL